MKYFSTCQKHNEFDSLPTKINKKTFAVPKQKTNTAMFPTLLVCTTVLPPTSADLCDINGYFGEINQLYITRYGDSLTNWEAPVEWAARLSNTTVLPSSPTLAPIRTLFGIGGIAAPERTEIAVSRRRSIFTTPKYSFTFNVEDTGDTNMAFNNLIPVGGQQYAGWFGTEERLFGGNDGVLITLISDPIIPESIDELMKLQMTITWRGTFPEVTDNFLS